MSPAERSRAWPRRSIQLLLTVSVTWFVLAQVDVTLPDALASGDALPNPSGAFITASVVVLLWGFVMSAWWWARMTRELGGRDPGLIGAARIVFSANLGRYLPGRFWQIAGLAVLSGRDGISPAVAGTAGVLGQAFSLAAVGVLAAPVLLGPGYSDAGSGIVIVAALVLFITLTSIRPILRATLGLAFRIGGRSVEPLPRVGSMFGLRWLGLYLLNWTLYGLAFVLFVRGLGFAVGWLELTSAFAAAYLLGYAAVFAPAGLGVREGFLIAFLQIEIGAAAVGVALLTRLWMTAVELLPAGGFALWEIARTGGPRGDPSGGPRV